jgi:hypothetical protein
MDQEQMIFTFNSLSKKKDRAGMEKLAFRLFAHILLDYLKGSLEWVNCRAKKQIDREAAIAKLKAISGAVVRSDDFELELMISDFVDILNKV